MTNTPNTLLDHVAKLIAEDPTLKFRSDRRFKPRYDNYLAYRLGVQPANISKIRNGKLPIGATLMLAIHDLTGMSIHSIKTMKGTI